MKQETIKKEVNKMTEKEVHEEMKESSAWNSRYFELKSELEDRELDK